MLFLVRSRRHLAAIFWGLLILTGPGSALGYYTVSAALTPEPPAKAFAGWIGILQPTSTLEADVQVRVNAIALTHTSRPRMAYGATVCGSGPFSGYFLIGGDARLQSATLSAGPGAARQLPDGDVNVDDLGDGSTVTYPAVQVIRVSIKELPRCLGTVADEGYIGVGFRIEGTASGPVVASSGGPFLDGAVERWSMPYVGSFPGAGRHLGEFRISGAIRGDFVRPAAFAATVDAGPVPLGLDLSDARPPTEAVDRASWYQPEPYQATAKVRDSGYQTTLQRWSALFAIGLGVFGSIVASSLFEWTRSRTRSGVAETRAHLTPIQWQPMKEPTRPTRVAWRWVMAAGAGYVVGRLRSRSHT